MTTQLFEESLLEAKKLREVAQKEAEKTIISEIAPVIKEMIEKELSGKTTTLLEEVDEMPPEELLGAPPVATPMPPSASPVAPPISPKSASDSISLKDVPPPSDLGPTVSTGTPPAPALEPPVTPPVPEESGEIPPVETPELESTPMPDSSGKITVDFEELFEKGLSGIENASSIVKPEVLPGEESPAPLTPEQMNPTQAPIDATEINQKEIPLSQPESVPALPEPTPEEEYENFQEAVSYLEQAVIKEGSLPKGTEQALVGLFGYIEEKADGRISARLKKLFESRLENLYNTVENLNQLNSYNMKLIKEGNNNMGSLRDFARSLFENSSAGFGDEGEAKEEVINSLDGAAGSKASSHAMSASDSTPVEDPGKKESLKAPGTAISEKAETKDGRETLLDEDTQLEISDEEIKAEAKRIRRKTMKEAFEEDKDLNINIDLAGMGDDFDSLAGEDEMASDLFGGETSVEPEMPAEGDVAGDEEIEVVADGEGDEGMEETEEMPEEEPEGPKGYHFAERVVRENKELRKQLGETQLLTARSLYLNKFLAREDLSRDQKQKIVEYLDTAKTITEAKAVYNRVKRVLDSKKTVTESKKPSAPVGSSSQATAKGSAVITESKKPAAGGISVERMRQLAGISKKV